MGEKQSAALVLLSKPSGQGLARTPEPGPPGGHGARQGLQRLGSELPGTCLVERGAGTVPAEVSCPGTRPRPMLSAASRRGGLLGEVTLMRDTSGDRCWNPSADT